MFKQDKVWAAKLTESGSSSKAAPTQTGESSSSTPDPETALPDYLQALQEALQPPTRHAALLPNAADLTFHKTLDRPFGRSVDAESSRVLSLADRMRGWIAAGIPSGGAARRGFQARAGSSKGKQPQALTERSLEEDEFGNTLGDLIDHLLERADTCLDEYSGKAIPRPAAPERPQKQQGNKLPKELLNAPINPLPQTKFTTKADNRSGVPWSRTLQHGRPHARQRPPGWVAPVPKDSEGNPLPDGPRQGQYMMEDDPRKHPYHYEIVTGELPDTALEPVDAPQKPADLNPADPEGVAGVPFEWIRTEADIRRLLVHLKEERVREIAIDLEHHSFRTYQGLVCLMQLSTRWGDYIVDTLSDEVREHAELLNEAFADPSKVKVLHGADHDILWLQRDLGLYVVGLFDTYHATHVLEMPSHGLAYLLQRYCQFEADKRYQLADWRIRPLPREMLFYARSDTHSLLYIYDRLRAELRAKGGPDAIIEVFQRSKRTASKVYAKPVWSEAGEGNDGWRQMWGRMTLEGRKDKEEKVLLGLELSREMRLVKAIHKWRDEVARELDESPKYILSAAHLMSLANRAPRTKLEVIGLFSNALPVLRNRAAEVAALIDREVKDWEAERDAMRERALAGADAVLNGADAAAGEDTGVALSAAAAASALALPVNTAIWPVPAHGLTSSASISTPSAPRLLAAESSLFHTADVRPVAAAAAAEGARPAGSARQQKKAKAARSLFAMPETGNPFAKVSLQDLHAEDRAQKVQAIRRELSSAMVHVLRDARSAPQTDTPASAAGAPAQTDADGDTSMEPETVPYVPKGHRKTVVAGSTNGLSRFESLFVKRPAPAPSAPQEAAIESAATTAPSSSAVSTPAAASPAAAGGEDDLSADVIQVTRKVDEDKLARRQEKKKRKRELKRQQAEGQQDGAGAGAADEGVPSPGSAKRQKTGSSAKPSQSQTTAEYDFSQEVSLLDRKPAPAAAPAHAGKGAKEGKKKKDGKDKDQQSKTPSAPRKRNELGSGNKSFTFRS